MIGKSIDVSNEVESVNLFGNLEGDNTLLDESVLNDDIMDDDELNEELDDEANHELDSNHEDSVLKTPPDSVKSKSPEPTPPTSEVTQKKVILKRKLNIVFPLDTPTSEVSTAPSEKTRNISISTPATTDTPLSVSSVSSKDQTNVETTDKKIKLSQLTAKERLELRAKKFGAPIATESLKAARSERFGLTSKPSDTKTVSNSSSSSIKNGNSQATVDLLKKRAERFGGSVSKVMNKIENLEKLQKRSERFGKSNENKVTASGGSATSEQMSERARLRLERFKTTA